MRGYNTRPTHGMKPRSVMNRTLLPMLAAAAALLAGLALYFAISQQHRATAMHLTVLNEPRPLPHFQLVDQAGEPFTADRFRGHWSLLFFGFSHCPDICPTTLYDLARFREAVADLPTVQQPGIYLVSVDPARDTPERLAAYVQAFDASFTGITGDEAQIARFAGALGVAYGYEPAEGDAYTVLHTAALFLLNPDGRFIAVSGAPHDMQQLAHDYRILIRLHGA